MYYMSTLFNLFFDICLLRKGPQDIPASLVLLKLCLLTYALSGLLTLLSGTGAGYPLQALVLVLVDIILLAGVSYGVLLFLGQPQRFTQTLTALSGTGTLLQLIALPLGLWYDRAASSDGVAIIPALLWLSLLLWSITITAHILRHAFAITFALGVLYALGYLTVSWSVAGWLLPLPSE